ncbi:uncharacterized protein A4U43_C01F3070 [Asparagus officinalis]|uniref:K Homology domain-containing protein n=1 Tax=Asparagus officinalis TaxID=4686 RepID=A0A5P1FN00_ASPOF|nr:uncharacterized protein A4U43_C01F3070 [Asparagus officinalis]
MADESQYSSSRSENKRKFDDPSPPPPPSYNSVAPPLDGIQLAKLKAQEIAAKLFSESEAKRPKNDNGAVSSLIRREPLRRAWISSSRVFNYYMQKPMSQIPSQVGMTQPTSFTPYGYGASKKIDVPNGRVGVIIGKSGETIRNLQLQSGAKIQVTRDMDADPNSQTRPVELTGTSEQVSRAEQLINDLLAEADAGASGSVSNRRFGGDVAGAEHFSMKVPNNKVGLIIGKGGETIKTMQANSGARIQCVTIFASS